MTAAVSWATWSPLRAAFVAIINNRSIGTYRSEREACAAIFERSKEREHV
jgi:hypothetical protein